MLFSTILACLAVGATSAAVVKRDNNALPKANEYKSADCSGVKNYGHHSSGLEDVTMDNTTHSVYLASPQSDRYWGAYSDKSKDGGECQGEYLGRLNGECQNLDTAMGLRLDDAMPQRIKCVRCAAACHNAKEKCQG